MNWFFGLISNPLLLTGLSSWFVAQVTKLVLYALLNHKLEWERLFGDGGMPSGHAATVASVAVYCALFYGTGSFEFAVTGLLAIIVCHDAMGVRLETGKQAIVINKLQESFRLLGESPHGEERLKEFVGHTPVQVLAGAALGSVNACVLFRLLNS